VTPDGTERSEVTSQGSVPTRLVWRALELVRHDWQVYGAEFALLRMGELSPAVTRHPELVMVRCELLAELGCESQAVLELRKVAGDAAAGELLDRLEASSELAPAPRRLVARPRERWPKPNSEPSRGQQREAAVDGPQTSAQSVFVVWFLIVQLLVLCLLVAMWS